MKKWFSIKLKLLIIFGLLVALSIFVLAFLAMQISKTAVKEKIEEHLIDKADDVAEIIDGNVNSFWQFFEGVARTPLLRNPNASYQEKISYLAKEAAFNERIHKMGLCEMNGIRHTDDGKTIDVSDRDYFIAASKGNCFVAEPIVSRLDSSFVLIFSVPVYNDNREIVSVLIASVEASFLSQDISDIVVGKTGYCYILGLTGTIIAHRDFSLVENMTNYGRKIKIRQKFTLDCGIRKNGNGNGQILRGILRV